MVTSQITALAAPAPFMSSYAPEPSGHSKPISRPPIQVPITFSAARSRYLEILLRSARLASRALLPASRETKPTRVLSALEPLTSLSAATQHGRNRHISRHLIPELSQVSAFRSRCQVVC